MYVIDLIRRMLFIDLNGYKIFRDRLHYLWVRYKHIGLTYRMLYLVLGVQLVAVVRDFGIGFVRMETMRMLRDEHGDILILTALCMTMLLSFMALAIDVDRKR